MSSRNGFLESIEDALVINTRIPITVQCFGLARSRKGLVLSQEDCWDLEGLVDRKERRLNVVATSMHPTLRR
jgi:hypothetical protein